MVSLTVELSSEDLAALQDYAAAHPETGGLAGAFAVAVELLRERRTAELAPAPHPTHHVVRGVSDHSSATPATPSWDRAVGQGLSA